MVRDDCPECLGSRLKKEALSVVIDEKNIYEVRPQCLLRCSDLAK